MSSKPKPPAERPLDDGARDGTEAWRAIDGVEFCHWDRWLLRLAITEPGGLARIADLVRQRVRNRLWSTDVAEAMLAQIADLQQRLGLARRTPDTLLDDEEKASAWLFRKAWRRVWESGPQRRTKAMRETPRWRLEQRALQGHAASFPVPPGPYEARLAALVGPRTSFHWSETGLLARMLETEVDLLSLRATPGERLALLRAAMTVILETMDRIDDSLAEMATTYEAIERAYLEELRAFPGRSDLLRDLLEFVVWEDYGLTQGVEAFLSSLPEADADRALRELASILPELRRERFDYQLARARDLRAAVLAAARSLPPDDPIV